MLKTRVAPAALLLLVGLLIAAQAGGLLRVAYPAAALVVGVWLEAVSVGSYVGVVLWLWMLSPLVRRLADVQAGWQDPSLVLLTPFLVTAWPGVKLLARALLSLARDVRAGSARASSGSAMFFLAALGTAAGIPLGVANAPSAAAVETLNWLVPVGFGWYVASREPHLVEIEQAVTSTFRWAALVLGAYGIYQFLSPPAWDVLWMLRSEMTTIGQPEPFAVRVFSTMHSPGVLAFFVFAPIVLWLARPRLLGLPAICVATITLVLSQVRSAWLALVVSALFVVLTLPQRLRVRVVALSGIAALCVTPFLVSPELSDLVSSRFASLMEPNDDVSAVSRVTGHLIALDYAAAHPLGGGLGFNEARIGDLISMRDSLVVAAVVQLGLAGAFVYGLGVCLLLARLWTYYRWADSPESLGLACAGMGLLSTFALGAVTAGAQGVVFWLIGGLAVAHGKRRAKVLASARSWPAPPVAYPRVRLVPATASHAHE